MTLKDQWTPIQLIEKPAKETPKTRAICHKELFHVAAFGYIFLGTIKATNEKTVFIISERHELIRDKIINDMKRGGTYLQGKGMYQGSEKNIIMTVVNRREVILLKHYIRKVDPKAFVMVSDANEIMGDGFKSLYDED
mgnify:CR=1 FL=1